MEGRIDHLEKELSDWQAREQRFKKLFGSSVVDSKAFLKEKLAFYEVLDLKYGQKGPGFDRIGAQIIRQEKRRLERKVFPNFFIRIGYKLIAAVVNKQQVVRAEKNQADNLKTVQAKVLASGFEGMETIIAKRTSQNAKQFSVPVSRLVTEEQKMDYVLKFSKGVDGNYAFDGYQAKLSGGEQNEVRSCLIGPATLKPEQAFNLLNGRPVLMSAGDGIGWVQIDLNDKDDKGNLKVRTISKEPGFDLSTALDKLPLKNAAKVKSGILAALENGQQVNAIFKIKGKELTHTLAANPLRNEVAIFNEKKEQLSPVDLKPKTKLVAGETREMERVNRKQMKVAR